MIVHQETITVQTRGKGMYDFTPAVRDVLSRAKVDRGVCVVFVKHTSASLVIQENADASVQRDLLAWLDRLAPESDVYEHDAEGADDMPAHLRSAMTRTNETIPVQGGELVLGTWQAVYLLEHRARAHGREVFVSVMGL